MNICKASVTSGVVVAATLLGGAVAKAADVQSGFYLYGNAQGGTFASSGEEFSADLTLGFSGADTGSMPFGAEVNLDYIALGGGDASAINYSLYYDSSFGRFSVGLPRAAVDDYVGGISPFRSTTLSISYGQLFSSYSGYMALISPTSPFDYGLRFDGGTGDLEYGISYLYSSGFGEGVTTAGARYTFADYYTVAVGMETIPLAPFPGLLASLQADYGNSGWTLGASRPVIGGGNTFYSASGFYDWNNFRVRAGIVGGGGSGFDLYNVGIEYSFLDNGYVGVEAIGGGGGLSEYAVYAGWNFDIGGM